MDDEKFHGIIKPIDTLAGHTFAVNSIIKHGNHAFSSSDDRTIKEWDLLTGNEINTLTGHEGKVISLRVHNGDLYSTSQDHTVRSWNPKTGEQKLVFSGHEGRITCFGLDGERLFSGSADNTIRLWNTKTGNCGHVFSGHTDQISGLHVLQNTLYSASVDKTLQSWDTETGQCTNVFVGHPSWVFCLEYNNGILYSGSKDGSIRAWDPQTGMCTRVFEFHHYPVIKIEVHDGVLYSGSWDGTIGCFNISSGQPIRIFEGHSGKITTFKIEENLLFSCSRDRTMRAWNLRNGRCDFLFEGSKSPINCVLVDDDYIATGCQDAKIIKWPSIKGKKSKGVTVTSSKGSKKKDRKLYIKGDPDLALIKTMYIDYDEKKEHLESISNAFKEYSTFGNQEVSDGKLFSEELSRFGSDLTACVSKGANIDTTYQSPSKTTKQTQPTDSQSNPTQEQTPQISLGPLGELGVLESTINYLELVSHFDEVDDDIGIFLREFAGLQNRLEKEKERLYVSVNKQFYKPLRNFSQLLKRAKRSIQNCDTARKEYVSKKKKRTSQANQFNVLETRFELAKLEAKNKMEEIEMHQDINFLRSVCTLMKLQFEFHRNAYDLLNEIEPLIGILQGKIALFEAKRSAYMLQNIQLPGEKRRKKPEPKKFLTLRAYDAQNENELSFEQDVIVNLVEKKRKMSLGEIDGKTGLFPNSLVMPFYDGTETDTEEDIVDTDNYESEKTETDGESRTTDFGDEQHSQLHVPREDSQLIEQDFGDDDNDDNDDDNENDNENN
ncbi:wd repeat-containing protein pop1 [Anaeramoeba ignava]|uniref:Wd repeat-containing protein pop1 n=1 Tax=Anaeramoeba ignava TaxID=1746090 RepID=A0A9Q0LLQ9_ANAIG|nr:wd repeat-containing protein pop1 [Anaeramoeba ignava]